MAISTQGLLEGTDIQRQIAIEKRAVRTGRERYFRKINDDADKGRNVQSTPAKRWLAHWAHAMILAMRAQRRKSLAKTNIGSDSRTFDVFLVTPPQKLAAIALSEVLNQTLSNPEGVKAIALFISVGRAALAQAQLDLWRKNKRKDMLTAMFKKRRQNAIKPIDVNRYAKLIDKEAIYDRALCTRIGAILVFAAMKHCSSAEQGEPFRLAFHHKIKYRGVKTQGLIALDDRVWNTIRYDHEALASIRPVYPPMVVPPYLHGDTSHGGYITIPIGIVTRSHPEQRRIIEDRLPKLGTVTGGLLAMGSTAIRVNKWMLRVIDQLRDNGGGVAGLPVSFDYPIPPRPDDQAKWPEWKREAHAMHTQNKSNATKFHRMSLVLGVARMYQDEPRLFMLHRLDFRGRCYPVAMYFNHHGGDLERSLIEFGEARDGERVSYHVAIQAATMYGVGSISYGAKVGWVRENLRRIFRAVDDPIKDDFWKEAKHPLQFLAACRAIVDKGAATRLPIQRDATASGFQHYTAMTRDEKAAPFVNLVALDEPSDLYREVALRTRDELATEPQTALIRRMMDDLGAKKGREISKNTTMTTAYAVTEYGARQQINRKLLDRGYDLDDRRAGRKMLATKTMKIIRDMFPRVMAAMDWIRECAEKIATAGRLVMWVAPTGFPVVQAYRKERIARIQTLFCVVRLYVHDERMPIHIQDQIDGSAPNFVHSVDAAHLTMTALEARNRGVAFLGVHDSYWTHAATTDELGAIARRTFADLHSHPLLHDLWEYWREQHPDIEFRPPPELGYFDPISVVDAEYALS